jgi:UDP-glucose 4-epimerase
MSKILITGASGFVGRTLLQVFATKSELVCYNRANNDSLFDDQSFGAVIHLAARVHVMNEMAGDPLAEFRKSNVTETLQLARRAVAAGVKRFVYVSSVKVNGELTKGTAFKEDDTPNPSDPYGVSKNEAEIGLRQIAKETGLEVVIVRPPLVYGAGVKANFASLTKIAGMALPLPLGAVNNRRSMIYVGNLVDFLMLCAHPARSPLAANETFLISDGQDVSIAYLLKTLACAQGKAAWLIPVPASWLKWTLVIIGKRDVAQRLLGDLQIDSSKARVLLGWRPPYTVEQGLIASV